MDVTIITTCISITAALSGIILGWLARSRELRKEIVNDTEREAIDRSDIKHIKEGVDDIRIEFRAQGRRIDALSERVTRVEESSKQAHKRIDEIKERLT